MKKLFTFLLFFVVFQSLPAETSLNLNSSQLNGVSLAPYIWYLEDTTDSLEIQDILKPENSKKFIKNQSDSLNFGFKSHPFWFTFSVENSSSFPLEWVLEIGYPMLDQIELFILKEDGTYEVKTEGDEKPFHERNVKYRNFLFELTEKPYSKNTYYIRITTTSKLSYTCLESNQSYRKN